jgi:hypothetical protein
MKKLMVSAAALTFVGTFADSAVAQAPGAVQENLYGQSSEAFFSIAEIQGHNTVLNVGLLDVGSCFFEDWVDLDVLRLSENASRIRVSIDLQEFRIVRCQEGMTQPVFVALTCHPDGLVAVHNIGQTTRTERINGEYVTTKANGESRDRSVECRLEIDDQIYEPLTGHVSTLRNKTRTR